MYSKITNPKTGRQVSIRGRLGRKVLINYLNILVGGAPRDRERLMTALLSAQRRTASNLGAVPTSMRVAAFLPDADPSSALKNKWLKFKDAFDDTKPATKKSKDNLNFLKKDFLDSLKELKDEVNSYFNKINPTRKIEIKTPEGWKHMFIEKIEPVYLKAGGEGAELSGYYLDDNRLNEIPVKNFYVPEKVKGSINFRYVAHDNKN